MTNIGFTGTRKGMTTEQRLELFSQMEMHVCDGAIARHGDCVGADYEFHHLALTLGFLVTLHPPDYDGLRAFCKGAEHEEDPRPYLVRNRDIVKGSDLMFATPGTSSEVRRSGTWDTIRYAKESRCSLIIIYPNGSTGSRPFLGPRAEETLW